jgi:hypothetical protein
MNTILNKATIKTLRQAGFKVRVLHCRPTQKIQKFDGTATEYNPKGGKTTIQITSPDSLYDAEGTAICSEKDSWNRRMGNSIALGRAINKLNQEIENNTLVLY